MCVCVCVCVYLFCGHSLHIMLSTHISIPITLQLDVAIGHEMTCQYELALGMYNDLHLLLERTIAKHSSDSRSQCPQWLKKMTSSWYQCWDCPNLTHPEKAWKVSNSQFLGILLFRYCKKYLLPTLNTLEMSTYTLLTVYNKMFEGNFSKSLYVHI